MAAPARLTSLLMFVRKMQIDRALEFYGKGVGLRVLASTESFIEFDAGSLPLRVVGVEREAEVTAGYTPLLQFEVDDMDATIQRVMMMGASLDGPIKYPLHGKVASIRAPDGHMVGLYEPSGDVTAAASAAFAEELAAGDVSRE